MVALSDNTVVKIFSPLSRKILTQTERKSRKLAGGEGDMVLEMSINCTM